MVWSQTLDDRPGSGHHVVHANVVDEPAQGTSRGGSRRRSDGSDAKRAALRSRSEPDLAGVLLRDVRGPNAFESTVEQLATAIRLGVFAAGDRLPPERELAESMNVSRTTLREAIAALREAGLVTTRAVAVAAPRSPTPRRRQRRAPRTAGRSPARSSRPISTATVTRFSSARRRAWGGVHGGRTRLSVDQQAWLRGALLEVSREADVDRHRQADSRFHLAIATLAGSPRLLDP